MSARAIFALIGAPLSRVFLWVVPAHVAGNWRWESNVAGKRITYSARIAQHFQHIDGEISADGERIAMRDIKLRGGELDFALVREVNGIALHDRYRGTVSGDRMSGRIAISESDVSVPWTATRTERGTLLIE
jgi:hypothetical protein